MRAQIICVSSEEFKMDSFAVIGYVFGILGLVAFIRVEKLTKTLKAQGVLPEDYKVN
jgi:hypothetical protein